MKFLTASVSCYLGFESHDVFSDCQLFYDKWIKIRTLANYILIIEKALLRVRLYRKCKDWNKLLEL